jgi:hypothetical protein
MGMEMDAKATTAHIMIAPPPYYQRTSVLRINLHYKRPMDTIRMGYLLKRLATRKGKLDITSYSVGR